MGSFFSIDSPFFTFMNKLCDIIVLSIVYVITCLGIVTIGPATTALYYATAKVLRRERGYLLPEYFRSFKANFKSGAFITIVLGVAALILAVDRNYVKTAKELSSNMTFVMSVVFNVMTIMLVFVTLYIFPVLSRFTIKGKQLIKTSFFMSIRHLPTTIVVGVIVIVVGFFTYCIPVLLMFTPALTAFICSFMIERVFKKYMPAPNENAEAEGTDEWYLE